MAEKIDLQGLINEVLNMVRSRQGGGDTSGGWYGGNKDEEKYWEEIRRRNTDLERQGLANTGALNVERERSTGELARQKLVSDTATNVANIGLEGHVRGHEIAGQASRDVATIGLGQAGKDPMIATLHAMIAKDPDILTDANPDPKTGKTRWQAAVENARQLNVKPPGADEIRAFHTPSPAPAPSPAPIKPTITNVSAPRPEGPPISQVTSISPSGEGTYTNPLRNNLTTPAPTNDQSSGLRTLGKALTWPLQAMTSTISPESVSQELTKRKKKFGEM